MRKKLHFDTEFNQLSEDRTLNPVCVSVRMDYADGEPVVEKSWWLLDPDERAEFIELMNDIADESDEWDLVCYNVGAEAAVLYKLGIDPKLFYWIDLYVEYRMFVNGNLNTDAMIGKHYVNYKGEGQLATYMTELDYNRLYLTNQLVKIEGAVHKVTGRDDKDQVPLGLEACTYKLLGVTPSNPKHKKIMQKMILTKEVWTRDEVQQVLAYCESDIADLPRIEEELYKKFKQLLTAEDYEKYHDQKYLRGDYSAAMAICEVDGYPVNSKAINAIASNRLQILSDLGKACNDRFPYAPLFEFDKKSKLWKKKNKLEQNIIETFITGYELKGWPMTAKGKYQTGKDVYEKFFDVGHHFDESKLYHHVLNYKKTESALKGLKDPSEVKNFWDRMNLVQSKTDAYDRVHTSLMPFKGKTSRSQPKSTSFMFLKTAWLRSLVQPKPGRMIIGVDYGSQEFLLQGLISDCQAMIDDYFSEDVYFSFAKKCDKTIPPDADKHDPDHGWKRKVYKTALLGMSYKMGAHSLARRVTEQAGQKCSVEMAQEIIDTYNREYSEFYEWGNQLLKDYRKTIGPNPKRHGKGYIQLNDGWTLFGGGEWNAVHANEKSTGNFPIQGAAAAIMRDVVLILQEQDIQLSFTLHDAFYVECDTKDADHTLLTVKDAMVQGFQNYFKDTNRYEDAGKVRLDPCAWSPDGGKLYDGTPVKKIYIDERGQQNYERFKHLIEM